MRSQLACTCECVPHVVNLVTALVQVLADGHVADEHVPIVAIPRAGSGPRLAVGLWPVIHGLHVASPQLGLGPAFMFGPVSTRGVFSGDHDAFSETSLTCVGGPPCGAADPSRGCLRREADRFPREENRGPGTMKASERASKEPWACADGEVEAAVLTSKVKYESQEEGPGPAPQPLVEVSGQMKWTVVMRMSKEEAIVNLQDRVGKVQIPEIGSG